MAHAVGDLDGDTHADFLFVGDGRTADLFAILYGNQPFPVAPLGDPAVRKTIFFSSQHQGFVPQCLGWGDYDGGGIPDLVLGVGVGSADPGAPHTNKVYLVLGAGRLGLTRVDLDTIGTGGIGCVIECSYPVPGDAPAKATSLRHRSPPLGDVSGDGRDDVALWLPFWNPSRLVLVFGRAAWQDRLTVRSLLDAGGALSIDVAAALEGWATDERSCWAVAPVGDIDGDGAAELAWAHAGALAETGWNPLGRAASWILWEMPGAPGAEPPWGDLRADVTRIDDFVMTGGAGDVDDDGFRDFLGYTVPQVNVSEHPAGQPSRAFAIYGAPRELWPADTDAVSLNAAGKATLLPDLDQQTQPFAAGCRHVSGGFDSTGDGIPDFIVGNRSSNLTYGNDYIAAEGGKAIIVAGKRGRPASMDYSTDPAVQTILEGVDPSAHFGFPLSFFDETPGAGTRLLAGQRAGASSLNVPGGGPGAFEVSFVPRQALADTTLSVHHWRAISGYRVMIAGAGFAQPLAVSFGQQPGTEIQVASPCVAFATAPLAPPGTEVQIVVKKGAVERIADVPFTYPEATSTPTAPLSNLAYLRQAHAFDFATTGRTVHSCLPVGDFDGDGVEDIAFGIRYEDHDEIWIAAYDEGLLAAFNIFENEAFVRTKLVLPAPDLPLGQVTAAADLNGDQLQDLVCMNKTGKTGTYLYVVFGKQAPAAMESIAPGQGAVLLAPDGGTMYLEWVQVELLRDIDGDGIDDIAIAASDLFSGQSTFQLFVMYGSRDLASNSTILLSSLASGAGLQIPGPCVFIPAGDFNAPLPGEVGFVHGNVYNTLSWGERVTGSLAPEDLAAARSVSPAFAIESFQPYEPVVSGPVDFDGDGYPDLMLGKLNYFTSPENPAGALGFFSRAFLKAPSTFVSFAEPSWPGNGAGLLTGGGRFVLGGVGSATSIGDIDGDRRSDILVSVADRGRVNRALLVMGDPNWTTGISRDVTTLGGIGAFLDPPSGLTPVLAYPNASRDVDRDGLSDFIVAFRDASPSANLLYAYLCLGTTERYWQLRHRDFRRGDSNIDGTVNIADAIVLLTHLFGSGPKQLGCEDAGDANDDGQLNVADPIKILSHLFARTGPLPLPFGTCGPDPTTGDSLAECIYSRCDP